MDSFEQSSKLSVTNLEVEVSKVIKTSLDRRTTVLISPTLDTGKITYDGMIFSKKYRDLLTLTILLQYSEYFGDFREYVIYEVQRYLEDRLLFPEIAAMLHSKRVCLDVLLHFSRYHTPHAIFGNLLNPEQINRVLDSVHLRLIKPRKVIRPVYRRGYKDKGSLRPETRWLPTNDWSYSEEQVRIEQRRKEYFDLITTMVRVSGDRVLKEQYLRKEV